MDKTLIIHPRDTSTVFLKDIYKDLPDATIITGGKTQNEVHQLMKEHHKIMMMGHGSPFGLYAGKNFREFPEYIIDITSVPFLKGKNNVFVWCHADKFVKRFELKGFF